MYYWNFKGNAATVVHCYIYYARSHGKLNTVTSTCARKALSEKAQHCITFFTFTALYGLTVHA